MKYTHRQHTPLNVQCPISIQVFHPHHAYAMHTVTQPITSFMTCHCQYRTHRLLHPPPHSNTQQSEWRPRAHQTRARGGTPASSLTHDKQMTTEPTTSQKRNVGDMSINSFSIARDRQLRTRSPPTPRISRGRYVHTLTGHHHRGRQHQVPLPVALGSGLDYCRICRYFNLYRDSGVVILIIDVPSVVPLHP